MVVIYFVLTYDFNKKSEKTSKHSSVCVLKYLRFIMCILLYAMITRNSSTVDTGYSEMSQL